MAAATMSGQSKHFFVNPEEFKYTSAFDSYKKRTVGKKYVKKQTFGFKKTEDFSVSKTNKTKFGFKNTTNNTDFNRFFERDDSIWGFTLGNPTGNPSSNPSDNPTGNPSDNPTGNPSSNPTGNQSVLPRDSTLSDYSYDTSIIDTTTLSIKIPQESKAPCDLDIINEDDDVDDDVEEYVGDYKEEEGDKVEEELSKNLSKLIKMGMDGTVPKGRDIYKFIPNGGLMSSVTLNNKVSH